MRHNFEAFLRQDYISKLSSLFLYFNPKSYSALSTDLNSKSNSVSEYSTCGNVNKERTPKISPEYPVTNTPRSGIVKYHYKCGKVAVKNPLDSRI